MAARRAALLQAAVALQIHGSGMSGKGGGDGGIGGSGGSGTLGGMSAAQSILLQAVIGVWIIAAMLTAAYVFRDQIIDLLQDNGIVTVEMTQAPSIETTVPVTIEVPTIEITPLAVTANPGDVPGIEAPAEIQNAPADPKDKPGLHLGQTPGPPEPPNKDEPNNPDKPEKPKKK
jgi:hypothetical protein